MPSSQNERARIFVSYSRKDLRWLEILQAHLKHLERRGLVVDLWDDTKLQTGEQWRSEINKALNSARVVILLISADFMASDFIANNELPPLLAKAEENGVVILPLILSPSRFEKIDSLSRFMTVNPPSQPLINLDEVEREKFLLKLVDIILHVIEEAQKQPSNPEGGHPNKVNNTVAGNIDYTESSTPPRVFISYSWESENHKSWVRYLGERLNQSGIETRLDQWLVKPGESFTAFMEQEVEKADFILVVCTPDYARKSNNRQGGVGYEQQILAGQLMAGISRAKFIPILRKGDSKPGPDWAIPRIFEGVDWVDFRKDAAFEESFEDLIRTIFSDPRFAPPPLAADPAKLMETEGPSAHIATDMWTLNDALGYRAYAYAIYRFMTHEQTRPPLTISIQAPWGGGKTSLMRMIQQALDPDALKEVKEEAQQKRGEFTIEQALKEIKNWIERKTQQRLPPTPEDQERKLLTVWFNAWKYESANQVWAGLVNAIMHQVAARLTLSQRERFWLLLNLKRVDADKLRHRIYERILRYWRRWLWLWVLVWLATVTSALWLFSLPWQHWFSLPVIGTIAIALIKFIKAQHEVKEEPAAVSLSEYLDIPDYNKELGFIHNIEADLRRVLDSVPKKYRPIVIFIDDLDRCSPTKVAAVVEAVNLFLAGDFPNCMFVLGMDSEMVAAALQSAHKDMIAGLPEDVGIPVGWRFMDKFVQLPFLIPPSINTNLSRYTKALFSTDNILVDSSITPQVLDAAARLNVLNPQTFNDETERFRQEHKLDEMQMMVVRDQLETRAILHRLDEGIAKFNDRNHEIISIIETTTTHFCNNPRELKRFVNAFRFHYFLWWAQRAQGLAAPSLEQLTRWTVLSMKWPEVVRWLRRGGGTELVGTSMTADQQQALVFQSRLKLLEEISGGCTTMQAWHEKTMSELRLTPEKTSWLNDDDLLQFFRDESNLPLGQRLSDGVGQGLW